MSSKSPDQVIQEAQNLDPAQKLKQKPESMLHQHPGTEPTKKQEGFDRFSANPEGKGIQKGGQGKGEPGFADNEPNELSKFKNTFEAAHCIEANMGEPRSNPIDPKFDSKLETGPAEETGEFKGQNNQFQNNESDFPKLGENK